MANDKLYKSQQADENINPKKIM